MRYARGLVTGGVWLKPRFIAAAAKDSFDLPAVRGRGWRSFSLRCRYRSICGKKTHIKQSALPRGSSIIKEVGGSVFTTVSGGTGCCSAGSVRIGSPNHGSVKSSSTNTKEHHHPVLRRAKRREESQDLQNGRELFSDAVKRCRAVPPRRELFSNESWSHSERVMLWSDVAQCRHEVDEFRSWIKRTWNRKTYWYLFKYKDIIFI